MIQKWLVRSSFYAIMGMPLTFCQIFASRKAPYLGFRQLATAQFSSIFCWPQKARGTLPSHRRRRSRSRSNHEIRDPDLEMYLPRYSFFPRSKQFQERLPRPQFDFHFDACRGLVRLIWLKHVHLVGMKILVPSIGNIVQCRSTRSNRSGFALMSPC